MDLFEPSKPGSSAEIRHMGLSKTSDHIQIKIKIPNASQEPPTSSEARNQALKELNVLYTFNITMESQNLEQGCIKDQ